MIDLSFVLLLETLSSACHLDKCPKFYEIVKYFSMIKFFICYDAW